MHKNLQKDYRLFDQFQLSLHHIRVPLILVSLLVAASMLISCTGTILLDPGQPTGERHDAYPEIRVLDDVRRLEKGEEGPAFQLAYADGTVVHSIALQGQPILINFWATWCGPCRREMPAIVAAAAAHEDLVVIAINQLESTPQIEAFVEEFQMDSSILVAKDVDGKIGRGFGVTGLPTTVFIDRNGEVSAVWSGYLSREMLQEFLIDIL